MRCRPLWRCCKRQQQPGVSILTVPVLLPIAARQGVAREAALVRESGRLGPATDLKLAIDVRQVVLDRLLAEPEVRGDLFVRAARRASSRISRSRPVRPNSSAARSAAPDAPNDSVTSVPSKT